MTSPGHGIPPLDELRESLREAARRDVAARAPARRRRRRGLAVALVVLLGGAAAAGAADLISSGEPVPDTRGVPGRYHPSSELQLAVKAPDTPLPWGVGVYEARDGESCAVVGRVRGATLGELRGGTFHAYVAGRPGLCGDRDGKTGYFFDLIQRDGRSIVYGRARDGVRSITVRTGGKSYPARIGAGGAFVVVFAAGVTAVTLSAG